MSENRPEKQSNESFADPFADEEALAREIAELRIEIARIENMKNQNDWEHKLQEKISQSPDAVQSTSAIEETIEKDSEKENDGWDFSSEFESVEVYQDNEPEDSETVENKQLVAEDVRNEALEKDVNTDESAQKQASDEANVINDDEIVQMPPESEELEIPVILEEKEIVKAPRQVSPPSIKRLTDSEVKRKQKPAPPRKITVRKKNDAAIIKELGIGEGQKALQEAREGTISRKYYIRASKPDSQKIRKKLLKSLAEVRFENINIAKVEIDFKSARPYLIIGKSLSRRQAQAVLKVMRSLKIPSSVKSEQS